MSTNRNPTVRQRRLARRLRDLRLAVDLTHADAARLLDSAESKVSRIESGQSGIRLPDLRVLMDGYKVTDPEERAEIETLAREARKKGWWSRYANAVDADYLSHVAAESDATELYDVGTHAIPGLLQTPEYTRALAELQAPHATPERVEALIGVCGERRKVLSRTTPVRLWATITEDVLHHGVGAPGVMRAQLEALIEDSRMPNVQLQVLPRDHPMNACLYGPFVIMGFQSPAEADIIYHQSPTGWAYSEEAADVDTYSTLFRRLNAAAANADTSRALINDALREVG